MAEALRIIEDKIVNGGIGTNDEVVNNTLDYLRRFLKVDPERVRDLILELMKRFGLAKLTAIQIINIMPQTVDELRILLGSEKREFSDQDIEGILDLLRGSKQS